ncbi:WhiB family transcriptional regulator [Streptomyces sp. DH-12]|nr:WhiB family transcriptional regulator [Streptomyces sp. DH-12]
MPTRPPHRTVGPHRIVFRRPRRTDDDHHGTARAAAAVRSALARPIWEEALCRTVDPELFFPVGEAGAAAVQTAEAKRICGRCPLTRACREWALSEGEDSGVWGGLSEQERRVMRRAAARRRYRRSARAA